MITTSKIIHKIYQEVKLELFSECCIDLSENLEGYESIRNIIRGAITTAVKCGQMQMQDRIINSTKNALVRTDTTDNVLDFSKKRLSEKRV